MTQSIVVPSGDEKAWASPGTREEVIGEGKQMNEECVLLRLRSGHNRLKHHLSSKLKLVPSPLLKKPIYLARPSCGFFFFVFFSVRVSGLLIGPKV